MTIRVGINGFGRIGRLVYRALYESRRDDMEVVIINDPADAVTKAHLLKYDTVHGRFPGEIGSKKGTLVVDGTDIPMTRETEPANIPWQDHDVDLVMECTGRFTGREDAGQHIAAGVQKVLISAPASDPDITVVYGVNHDQITADHAIVSNASCTTNCLAPVAKVLHDSIGIENGFMTTIHAYTGDQRTVDSSHKDLHRARTAAANMIPTSTGAAKAVGLVLPELNGKLDGVSIRVPTPNVSLVDLTFTASKATTAEAVNAAMTDAAQGAFKGIIGVYDEPLVSSDINHDPHSAMFSLDGTKVIDDTLVRVMAWYDNEWGFSMRMLDTAATMMAAG